MASWVKHISSSLTFFYLKWVKTYLANLIVDINLPTTWQRVETQEIIFTVRKLV